MIEKKETDFKKDEKFAMPFKSAKWVLIGFGIMVLGYILMAGGGSRNPAEFSPAIFSFRRIVIAPIVIILGIVAIITAIIKKRVND